MKTQDIKKSGGFNTLMLSHPRAIMIMKDQGAKKRWWIQCHSAGPLWGDFKTRVRRNAGGFNILLLSLSGVINDEGDEDMRMMRMIMDYGDDGW